MALWTRKNEETASAVRFVRTEHNATGGVYHVHSGPDRGAAVAFLRQSPPQEELVYNIVETPQGNVGCDFIYLFEEADGKPLDFAPRARLEQAPTPSKTHCAWCGFFVVPYERKLPRNAAAVQFYLTHDELAELAKTGEGLACRDCGLVTCILCTGLDPAGGNTAEPRCRACRGGLDVFVSASQ
jgi:hypothetical protein